MTEEKSPLEKAAEKDRNEKLFLKEKEENYYRKKRDDLGLRSIDRLLDYHPSPSKNMQKGITFAYQDLGGVAKAMANNEPWAVVSGLNPSGPLHMGHKLIFDELLWLQEQGADVFIPITNDESYVVGKSSSLGQARTVAYEEIIPSIIAMGFDAKRTHIYVDTDYPDIYKVAMDLSTKVTFNKASKTFGFHEQGEEQNPGTFFYRSAIQVAQILLLQYEEFGGRKPTLVPVGIDQHPYLLLARDVAEKKGFIPPAELDMRFLWGLDGKGKMSASREKGALFLTDDTKTAERKIQTAYTGGSPSAAFQRIHGGIPEICPVYTLQAYHFLRQDDLYGRCSSGETLCGECKKQARDHLLPFLEQHQELREEAKAHIQDYLLTTPLRSLDH